jgi:hypothetical protein
VQILPVPQAQSAPADATCEAPAPPDLLPPVFPVLPVLPVPLDRLLLALLAELTELATNCAAPPLLLLREVLDE